VKRFVEGTLPDNNFMKEATPSLIYILRSVITRWQ